MEKPAVGITGKLWRKVTPEEVEQWNRLASENISMREIARRFSREHSIVRRHLTTLPDHVEVMRQRRKRGQAKIPRGRGLVHVLNVACQMARRRSMKRSSEMDIDVHFALELYEKQHAACALTGIPFVISKSTNFLHHPHVPSIDRIDSKKGYTRDNVRLTLWIVNHALGEWGEEHFAHIAEAYLAKRSG